MRKIKHRTERDSRIVLLTHVGGQGIAESGDENRHDALICTFRKQRTIFRMLCSEKKNLERLTHYTVVLLTNPHTIRGGRTLQDVEWFRNKNH